MPECSLAKSSRLEMTLLFCSIAFGSFFSFLLLCVFIWKWHFQLDSSDRRRLISRLSAMVVTVPVFERSLRIQEAYMWFHSARWASTILYISNNIVSLTGILGGSSLLLMEHYKEAFVGSVLQISESDMRILRRLAAAVMIGAYTSYTINGIDLISLTVPGRVTILLLNLVVLVSGVTFIVRIFSGLASRLQRLVVITTAMDYHDPTHLANHQGSNTLPTAMPPTKLTLSSKSSLSGIRNANVGRYRSEERTLLRSAAKSGVLAAWITLSLVLFVSSGVLWAMSDCTHFLTSLGQILFGCAQLTMSFAVFVTLPKSNREYQWFCHRFQKCLEHFVAYNADVQVLELTRKNSAVKDSNTASNI